jgi:hypothetical protein
MMLSPRYLPAIAVLLAAALVPTLIHSYTGDARPDDRTTAAVPHVLAGYASTPSGRAEGWGERRFDSFDWTEREYSGDGSTVRLTVVRSYDLKSLYHHPELAVAYGGRFGGSFERAERVRLAARSDVPVHLLRPAPGSASLAMYVLEYDGEYVEHPLWFQVRTAGALLFSRRKAMTLFFAHDLRVTEDASLDDLPSVSVLLAAVDSFARNAPDEARALP